MGSSVRPQRVTTPDDAEFEAWKTKGGGQRELPPPSGLSDDEEFAAWKSAHAKPGDVDLGASAGAPLRMPPVVVSRPEAPPRISTLRPLRGAIAASDASRVGAPANPHAVRLTGGEKLASDVFSAGASALEHPVETAATVATAPVVSAGKAGLFLGQRINDATSPGANDDLAAAGVPRVSDAEALDAAAQLASMGLGRYAKIIVGRTLAGAIGSRAAGVAGSLTEGAAVGASFDPENRARGAILGAGAAGVANELSPYRPHGVRIRMGGQDPLEAQRYLQAGERQPAKATARALDEQLPPAEPDYTVGVPDAAEFDAWKRSEAPADAPPAAGAQRPGLRRRIAEVIDPGIAAERRTSEAQRRSLEDELRGAQRAAETDALTGLANRAALDRALPTAEADPKTKVVLFDANNFGKVNKAIGHDAGDGVLKEMAAALAQAAQEHGVPGRVFRKGGDEFVVLAPEHVADALTKRAEQLFGDRQVSGADGKSVTVSVTGTHGATLKDADAQLQAAKETRKAGQAAPAPATDGVGAPSAPAPAPSAYAASREGVQRLYHGTYPETALRLALGAEDKGGLFVSPHEDLALGQSGKGAVVEFGNTDRIDVQRHVKPGSELVAKQTGQWPEYTVTKAPHAGGDVVRSVTMAADAKVPKYLERRAASLGWAKSTLPDGRIRYSNPAMQVKDGQITDEDGVDRFEAARAPGGGRRDVGSVSTRGLLEELLDLETKRADAESRAVYEVREDKSFATSGIPQIVSTKDKNGGPSMQAKAGKNLEDFARITDEVHAELAKRMPEEDIWGRLDDLRAELDERAGQNDDFDASDSKRDQVTDESGKVLFARASGGSGGTTAPKGGATPAAAAPAGAAPAAAPVPAVVAPTMNRHAAAARAIFAPTSLSPQAGTMGRIVREHAAFSAQQLEAARESMKTFARSFNRMAPADRLAFIDAIETGAAQPSPAMAPAAAQLRTLLDETRDQVRALGTGKLESWIENYFPHIWKDPAAAKPVIGMILGKRPLEGPKSFLKHRTIPTTKDGIAAGLEPVTDNPVDLTLLKLREMRRYIAAHRILQESEGQGLVKYVDATTKGPDGWRRIDDRIGTVYGKPAVEATEAFDAQVRKGLEDVIANLKGLTHERRVRTGQRGALGYAKGSDEMVSKFGTHDGVIMHELGHILDARYGLWRRLGADPRTVKELSDLAALRHESDPTPKKSYKKYVQKPEEQIANAVHAFLHAPERMAQVAPATKELLESFFGSKPELKPLLAIKPSLELKGGKAEIPVHGLVIRGYYYAPPEVARVLNNYLSPGLRGNALYDAYQGINNSLNQWQLGFSAFHVGFTSMDAAVSQAAVGLQNITHGRVLKGATQIATYPVAPLTTLWRGSKVLRAYLHPQGQPSELLQLVDAIVAGGGRARQDSFYQSEGPKHFMEALRHRKPLAAARYSLPAIIELAAKPVMEFVVPRQKLGVFAQLAERALADLPPNASRDDARKALGRAWDSVDNRLGQLVYDNLFWDKTLKDLAMASVRSVGWNLGTIRELGGGTVDLGKAAVNAARGQKPELTERASYTAMLPVVVGLTGAIMGYLLTGERPKELKDYFFPRTGKKNAEGNDERVQLPSYMKDVLAYAKHPVQTVEHKQAPLGVMVSEMLHNEDFYGDQIRNADDPIMQQLQEEGLFLAKQFIPLGVRNAQEAGKRVADPRVKVAGFVGVTAAPRSATRTDAENKIMELLATKTPRGSTPKESAQRELVGAHMTAARQGSLDEAKLDAQEDAGGVSVRQANRVRRAAEGDSDVWLDRFKRLNADEALVVYKLATPAEQAKYRDALEMKLIKAGMEDQLDALEPVHVSSTKK